MRRPSPLGVGCCLLALSLTLAYGLINTPPNSADSLYFFSFAFENFPQSYWNFQISPCPNGSWQGVYCDENANVIEIDLSGLNLVGTFDANVTAVETLTSLKLSRNNISGPIPPELVLLQNLRTLELDSNNLSGTIPNIVSYVSTLSCLNLTNNSHLEGNVPFKNSSDYYFPCVNINQTRLNHSQCIKNALDSCSQVKTNVTAAPTPSGSSVSVGAVVGGVVGGLALIAILVFGYVIYRKWQQKKKAEEEERLLAENLEEQVKTRHFGSLKRFSPDVLALACNDFDEDNLIGEGGFARVYKGTLKEGQVVAVKRIKEEKRDQELEFLNEVEIISRAVHKNLMRVVGFCVERGECMLVLPFMPNGSVATRTQGKEGDPMGWPTRLHVAIGAAEGIAYLHTDCKPKLIHRDIKAANVLLGEKDEPVIADFGLAREMDSKETHATTNVKGTIGYIAPEYFVNGQTSEKTDVYAFGMFLFEIISGKDAFDLTVVPEQEGMMIKDWVEKLKMEKRVKEFLDSEVYASGDFDLAQVEGMLDIALQCMSAEPSERPDMNKVTQMLSQLDKTRQGRLENLQKDTGDVFAESVMNIVANPSKPIWDNNTTGISLESFELSGPRD